MTKRKLKTVLAVALSTAACIMIYVVNPVGTWWMPKCMFLTLTGWRCPSCGLLRASHSLVHLRWQQALMYNPMLPVLLALAAVIVYRLLHQSRCSLQATRRWIWVYVGLYCLWGVVRNIYGL